MWLSDLMTQLVTHSGEDDPVVDRLRSPTDLQVGPLCFPQANRLGSSGVTQVPEN